MREIPWKSMTLKGYWRLFWRRKWFLVLPLLCITSVAILGSYLMTPIYQASTTLIAEEMERGSVLKGLSAMPMPARERMAMINQRLKSVNILLKVAEDINLQAELEAKKSSATRTKKGIRRYLQKITAIERRITKAIHLKKSQPITREKLVKYLRNIMSIRLRSQIIEITISHSNPKRAKEIADKIAITYVDDARQRRLKEVRTTYDFVLEQMQIYKDKLNDSEIALEKARESGIIKSLTDDNIELVNKLTEVEADLIAVEVDLRDVGQELQNLKYQLQNPEATTKPEIRELQDQVRQQENQLTLLKQVYGDSWPAVKQVKKNLAMAKQRLAQAQQEAKTSSEGDLRAQIKDAESQIINLNIKKSELMKKHNKYQKAFNQLPSTELSLSHLLREKAQNEKIYGLLLSRLDEADMLTNSELREMGSVAEVLDEAFLPEHPVKPNKKKIGIIAAILGLMVGFGLAFLTEYYDHSIHSVEEAKKYFDIPVLGTISELKEIKRLKSHLKKASDST